MDTLAFTVTRGDEQIDVDLEYVLSPFDTGNTYGPAENCYPPEGGELEELVAYRDGEPFALTKAEADEAEAFILENHEH